MTSDRVGPTIAVAVHIRQQDEIIAGLRAENTRLRSRLQGIADELDRIDDAAQGRLIPSRAAIQATTSTIRRFIAQ